MEHHDQRMSCSLTRNISTRTCVFLFFLPSSVPPSVPSVVDSRVKELGNSPAYTFLDGLQRAGKLAPAQVEFYKVKYQKLHEVVIGTYQNEKLLLDKAKELKSALETEKHKLEQRVSSTQRENTVQRERERHM